MPTMPLFEAPEPWKRVRGDDPPTSQAAARANIITRGTHRAKALAFFAAKGEEGGTDWELCLTTGVGVNSINRRRGDLLAMKLVRDSGRTKATNTGSPAIVWVITDEGVSKMAQIGSPDSRASG